MKFLLLAIFLSFSSFGSTIPQFDCVSSEGTELMEVHYQDNMLSYDDGRMVDVAVTTNAHTDQMIKVSGLAKNLVFTGGGSQSVSIQVDTKTKKGTISIYTRTFYRNSEIKKEVACTF